jgi:hypothetical protein
MAESLTEKEQTCHEYIKQAEELGVSFAEFCRSFDLNVHTWYSIRKGLVRKGVIAGRGQAEDAEPEKPAKEVKDVKEVKSAFAEVRIAPPAATTGVMCRIRHPSGWVIECAKWPDGAWLSALLAAGANAAA